jgi:hypothetical protein
METTQGISLFSYLYLKIAKILCLSYYHLCFSSKILEKSAEHVLPEEGEAGGRGERWPKQCMHI